MVAKTVDSDVKGQGEGGDPDITFGLEFALELVGVLLPAALRPAASQSAGAAAPGEVNIGQQAAASAGSAG